MTRNPNRQQEAAKFAKGAAIAMRSVEIAKEQVRVALTTWCGETSQASVAKTLGVSPQYVSDVIWQRRSVTKELVAAILQIGVKR